MVCKPALLQHEAPKPCQPVDSEKVGRGRPEDPLQQGTCLKRRPNSQMRSRRLCKAGEGARAGSMWKLSPWQEMGPLEMP